MAGLSGLFGLGIVSEIGAKQDELIKDWLDAQETLYLGRAINTPWFKRRANNLHKEIIVQVGNRLASADASRLLVKQNQIRDMIAGRAVGDPGVVRVASKFQSRLHGLGALPPHIEKFQADARYAIINPSPSSLQLAETSYAALSPSEQSAYSDTMTTVRAQDVAYGKASGERLYTARMNQPTFAEKMTGDFWTSGPVTAWTDTAGVVQGFLGGVARKLGYKGAYGSDPQSGKDAQNKSKGSAAADAVGLPIAAVAGGLGVLYLLTKYWGRK